MVLSELDPHRGGRQNVILHNGMVGIRTVDDTMISKIMTSSPRMWRL